MSIPEQALWDKPLTVTLLCAAQRMNAWEKLGKPAESELAFQSKAKINTSLQTYQNKGLTERPRSILV